MISILLFLFLVTLGYVCYHYINYLLSALIKRLLSCQRVQLQDISFRGVGLAKLSYEGYDVQLQGVRFWSNFFAADGKLLHLLIGDVRVEKRSKSAVTAQLSTDSSENGKDQSSNDRADSPTLSTPPTKSTKNLTRIMNYLQYVNLRIGTALIVLLDDVPDCLLHVTIEGLNFETFRDRDGLQLELQFRLIQAKLFMRNPIPAKGTSLLDIQLTGRASLDVVAQTGRVKKLGLHLKNPKISVSDVLFEYLLLHPPAARSSSSTLRTPSNKSKLVRLVDATPSLDIDLDNFAIEFIAFMSAASSRTLSLSLQKIKAEFNATERMGVAKFGDLNIGDHRATSNFKCIQFMAALNRQKPKEMTPEFVGIDEKAQMQKFDVEIRLGKESYEAKKCYLNN